MEIAYGTVRLRRLLDHAIELAARRRIDGLDAPVRAALRIGAYQLAFVDSAPAHAAVNETVELVREASLERAVPFANAVMRRLSRDLRELIDGLPDGTAEAAALRHSYPDWVARAWWAELGGDVARALMRAQNRPAETALRVNRRKIDTLPGVTDVDLPDARVVDAIPETWLEQGFAWPQSRGSQLAALAVGARAGDRTLDLCAAPGGKATQLAGEVVAVEVNADRARELEESVARLGATNVTVLHADARRLPDSLRAFDCVLVDAPCSGLGVLASRPDLRWRARPLPGLQLELLRAASARVRAGGTVTYAVCTMTRAETVEIVDEVGMEPDDLGAFWPRFRHPSRPEFLQTLPSEHGTSGFFVARLRRPAGPAP